MRNINNNLGLQAMGRVGWMDLSRTLAIFFVLLIHVTDEFLSGIELSGFQWGVYQSIRVLGRIGVPIFLMLSGALIMPITGNIKDFYKKRIPQFMVVTVVYFLLTNLVYAALNSESFNILLYIKSLAMGKTAHAYQLWYMYVIISIYLSAPFISKSISYLGDKAAIYLFLVSTVTIFIPTTIKAINSNSFGWIHIPPIHYMSYFILGYLICKKGFLKKTSLRFLIPFFAVDFFAIIAIQYYLNRSGDLNGEGITWYTSIFIMSLAVTAFLILGMFKFETKSDSLLTMFSKYSFGIYLFHLIPLFVSLHLMSFVDINILFKIVICLFVCFSSSCIYVAYVAKVPFIKKLVI